MNKKRILITGSAGFIGRHLCFDLKKSFSKVKGLDVTKNEPDLETKIICDASDKKSLDGELNGFKPNIIIHCAAIKNLPICEEDKEEAFKSNVLSTENITNYASKHLAKVIYISSDVVFDGKKGNYLETDAVNPINWYGKTKAFSEIIVGGLPDFAICRTALVVGTLSSYYIRILKKELHNNVLINQTLLPQYIYSKLKRKNTIAFPSTILSNPTPIELLSRFIFEIISRNVMGVFHTVGPNSVSRYEVAEIIAGIFNFDPKNVTKNNDNISPLRPRNISLNSDFTYKALGINPEDWQLEHYLSNKKLYNI